MRINEISYGDFITNWMVTQTDMFKIVISQNGMSDWKAMYGTTDMEFYFVPDQIVGTFSDENEKLKENSQSIMPRMSKKPPKSYLSIA